MACTSIPCMILTFVRHCESIHNAQHIHSDQDQGLSDQGIHQAEKLHTLLATEKFAKIFSSPLPRATQTGQIIMPNQELILDDRLKEVRKPSELINLDENHETFRAIKKALLEHGHRPNWRHSDEESYYQFHERIKDFLNTVEQSTLIITHSGVMRMILAILNHPHSTTENVIRAFLDSRHKTSFNPGTILKIEKSATSLKIIEIMELEN